MRTNCFEKKTKSTKGAEKEKTKGTEFPLQEGLSSEKIYLMFIKLHNE